MIGKLFKATVAVALTPAAVAVEGDAYEDSDATKEDVFMTRDQFERLPEFEGF